MRTILLAVLILFTCEEPHAQNIIDARTATVVSYWQVDDAKTYRLERTKTGRKNSSATMFLDLRVIGSTDSTYEVELLYRDMQVQGMTPPDEKAAQAMDRVMRSVDGMRVVVRTTDTGSFLEVTNAEEIKEHCDKITGEVLALAASEEERQAMAVAFGKMLTVESLSLYATEDVGNLLFPFGVEYTLGKKESVETELPNPFGGTAFPAVIEIEMTALDTATATAKIRAAQHIDPKALPKALSEMMESLGTSMSSKEKKEFERTVRGMKIEDGLEYDVDLNGAWVRTARCTRTVSVMDQVQTDERNYVLQ